MRRTHGVLALWSGVMMMSLSLGCGDGCGEGRPDRAEITQLTFRYPTFSATLDARAQPVFSGPDPNEVVVMDKTSFKFKDLSQGLPEGFYFGKLLSLATQDTLYGVGGLTGDTLYVRKGSDAAWRAVPLPPDHWITSSELIAVSHQGDVSLLLGRTIPPSDPSLNPTLTDERVLFRWRAASNTWEELWHTTESEHGLLYTLHTRQDGALMVHTVMGVFLFDERAAALVPLVTCPTDYIEPLCPPSAIWADPDVRDFYVGNGAGQGIPAHFYRVAGSEALPIHFEDLELIETPLPAFSWIGARLGSDGNFYLGATDPDSYEYAENLADRADLYYLEPGEDTFVHDGHMPWVESTGTSDTYLLAEPGRAYKASYQFIAGGIPFAYPV